MIFLIVLCTMMSSCLIMLVKKLTLIHHSIISLPQNINVPSTPTFQENSVLSDLLLDTRNTLSRLIIAFPRTVNFVYLAVTDILMLIQAVSWIWALIWLFSRLKTGSIVSSVFKVVNFHLLALKTWSPQLLALITKAAQGCSVQVRIWLTFLIVVLLCPALAGLLIIYPIQCMLCMLELVVLTSRWIPLFYMLVYQKLKEPVSLIDLRIPKNTSTSCLDVERKELSQLDIQLTPENGSSILMGSTSSLTDQMMMSSLSSRTTSSSDLNIQLSQTDLHMTTIPSWLQPQSAPPVLF